jgi:hypothetical protein
MPERKEVEYLETNKKYENFKRKYRSFNQKYFCTSLFGERNHIVAKLEHSRLIGETLEEINYSTHDRNKGVSVMELRSLLSNLPKTSSNRVNKLRKIIKQGIKANLSLIK